MAGGSKLQDHGCSPEFAVLLFYFYVDDLPATLALPDMEAFRSAHEALCRRFALDGRLRVSREGLNGNLSGGAGECEEYCNFLQSGQASCAVPADAAGLGGSMPSCDFKIAPCAPEHCFKGLKVWVANEVTGLWGDQAAWSDELEAERVALSRMPGGQHLTPREFHERLVAVGETDAEEKRDVVLFDARNLYETRVGHFQAPGVPLIDPGTRNFSDLREYFENADNLERLRGKEVFMYCTGGVRCERSSALLVKAGVAKAVYQLHGGIQRYMEKYSGTDSANAGFFAGKMHVFDHRGCVAPDGTVGSTEVKEDRNTAENTIARCLLCGRLWDQYKGKRRCACCNTLVLVCEHCQSAGRDRRDRGQLRCELCATAAAATAEVAEAVAAPGAEQDAGAAVKRGKTGAQ